MQRRRPQVWHLLFFLAVLLASSFPSLEVLDIRETTPEDSFADRQPSERSVVSGPRGDATSPRLPHVSLSQPLAIDTARITCVHLSMHPRSQVGPLLLRPPLLRRVSHSDTPSADPA